MSLGACLLLCPGWVPNQKVTEACRAAVLACVERSTNSEGRIVEVNAFADFFSKAISESVHLILNQGRVFLYLNCCLSVYVVFLPFVVLS